MGSALAMAAAEKKNAVIYLYDKDTSKAEALAKKIGAILQTDAGALAEICDIIFLGVKPNIIPIAAKEIKGKIKPGAVVVSMAAGVAIEKIEAVLGKDTPIIRIMPNTPVAVGAGMILWCKNDAVADSTADAFLDAMEAAGCFDAIDEGKIDAASALSGCGPAFVYMFIEALADGAVQCGLTRAAAQKYAEMTVYGAAKLALDSGKHPGELKDAVCSPGGSTIAGVHALEEGAFRASAADAVLMAYERTLELGK